MELNLFESSTRIPRRMSVSGSNHMYNKRSPTSKKSDQDSASFPREDELEGLSTKMRIEDLYLVANKMGQELQTLREFSDIEKELWKQDRASADKENLEMANFELEKARLSVTEVMKEKNMLEVQIQLLESALKSSVAVGQAPVDESLKVSLFSSKLEAKQALESLKVMKRNHLQSLKEKTSEKKVSMVKNASREICILDRS